MILKGLKVKKIIVIKTPSSNVMMEISKMIHNQLVGKYDYKESNIVLSIGDGSNKEVPNNEIHVYFFDECTEDMPLIAIGKFPNTAQVIIDISVKNNIDEQFVFENIYYQLYNNNDHMLGNICISSSTDREDEDINGNCVRIIYNDDRQSTPSLILL